MKKAACVALGLSALVMGCGSHAAVIALKPCRIQLARDSGWMMYPNDLVASMPDGSLVVGASHQHGASVSTVLRRVTRDCRTVRSFGANGTATIATHGSSNGEIDAIRATPDGNLLLAGSDGEREIVGRVLSNGQLDTTFGTQGWTRFKPHVKNPGMPTGRIATSIAIDPNGSIYLGGNDETAHCCTVDYVSKLTAGGELVQDFGQDGTLIIPKIGGSYVTDVSANRDGTVDAFAEYEQSGCGYPVVVRIRPDGSLDRRFDSAMAQTLRRLAPQSFRFTPTLVPGSADTFVLLGGLDKTCVLPNPRQPSGGVAVRITAAGGRAGETRFPSPNFAFDGATTIRLPSGRIVFAAEVYDNSDRVARVVVRSFASDGAVVGARTLPRIALSGCFQLDGLVPAPNGSTWLVMSSRKKIELIPVH